MPIEKLRTSQRANRINRRAERLANRAVRTWDRAMGLARLGGRKADYDDLRYEFKGGEGEALRRKHYDKSLRLLWKAEEHMPWSSFKDCSKVERQLFEMAMRSLTDEEQEERKRINSQEFRDLLNREYTMEQKEAVVALLAAIGHGEAYAWLVSAEVLKDVRSTGAKAAVTMQVLEEAKHFVVLRELIEAFEVDIRRQSAWEYLLLEGVLKSKGLEKFHGMNVVVEGIALSIFGLMSGMPGLEVLRFFHLDESRHTGLPANYFKEFPMSEWQKHSPAARIRRLITILPAIPIIYHLEEPAAELGFDVFDFGGSILRKITHLSDRVGFYGPIPTPALKSTLNLSFNLYCYATREGHAYRDYMKSETTSGKNELHTEREIFGSEVVLAAM